MKVFLSWSGDLSKAVASVLKDWIERTIQAAKVFMSDEDIETGTLWFTRLNEELQSPVGIICLTAENFDRPWILFEAGSIAKGLENTRVCPLLIDLEPINLKPPLAHYQASKMDKKALWGIAKMINECLPEDRKLTEGVLKKVFESGWKQLNKDLTEAIKNNPSKTEVKRPADTELIAEILELARNTNSRILAIEDELSHLKKNRNQPGRPFRSSSDVLNRYGKLVISNTDEIMNYIRQFNTVNKDQDPEDLAEQIAKDNLVKVFKSLKIPDEVRKVQIEKPLTPDPPKEEKKPEG